MEWHVNKENDKSRVLFLVKLHTKIFHGHFFNAQTLIVVYNSDKHSKVEQFVFSQILSRH